MDRINFKRQQARDAWNEAREKRDGTPLLVGQVMTAAPSCISPRTSVLDLVRMFHAKEFRHMLVTSDDGNLRGVISDRDVLRCFGPSQYPESDRLANICAEQVMSTDVVTVTPSTPLAEAVLEMVSHGISSLPVLVGKKLVGIITNTDLQVVLHELILSFETAQTEQMAGV